MACPIGCGDSTPIYASQQKLTERYDFVTVVKGLNRRQGHMDRLFRQLLDRALLCSRPLYVAGKRVIKDHFAPSETTSGVVSPLTASAGRGRDKSTSCPVKHRTFAHHHKKQHIGQLST